MTQKYRSPFLNSIYDMMTRQHYAPKTIKAYVYWIRRFILFHHKQHPQELGVSEIEAFLTHLAVD